MAPSKYGAGDSGPIVVLHQGLDSLWLNIWGEIKEDVLSDLAWSKEDAQASDADEALSPLPPFDGSNLVTLATGVRYYEWHARSRDLDVQLRKPSKRSPRPAAVIRVSAECLWRMGGGGKVAALLAADWLRPIFESGYRVTLSRVHVATDYQGYVPVLADLENVVSRAGDEEYFAGDEDDGEQAIYRNRAKRLTGVASGKSNNLRLNMYDKVLQARKKGLTWVADLWESCAGYRPDADVWRTEFQYGRTFLHDRAIETLDDLWPKLAALWAYGMAWYSFREPGADSNRSRWPMAAWWAALASWRMDSSGELPRVKVVRASWRRVAAGLAGYATSAMAITGLDDAGAALAAAFDAVLAGKADMGFLDKKLEAKKLHYGAFTMAG
jgi:hypothetical protein